MMRLLRELALVMGLMIAATSFSSAAGSPGEYRALLLDFGEVLLERVGARDLIREITEPIFEDLIKALRRA